MSILNFLQPPDPRIRLRVPDALPVFPIDPVTLADLQDTLASAASLGILALAANQVGVMLRLVVLRQGASYVHMVNPTVVSASGEQIVKERCGSVAYGHRPINTARSLTLAVSYFDVLKGKVAPVLSLTGDEAAAVQRALECLEGRLIGDLR